MSLFNKLFTFSILAFGASAASGISFPRCNSFGGERANVTDLHRVAVIGEDDRMTFSEYAGIKNLPINRVQKKLSATGIFSCNGADATGQLTGANDVVTTVGHHFFDKQCLRMDEPDSCYFQPLGSMEKFKVKIETLVSGCMPGRRNGDWAVIKLERPVTDASFYNLPTQDFVPANGQAITQVSAYHQNFIRNGATPPTVQPCSIRETNPYGTFKHDCDTGYGSSGSAQLLNVDGSTSPTMVALSVSQAKPVYPDGTPFGPSHYNLAVPVAGEFLKALNKTLGRN